jgi:hypothetical protein
MSTDHRVTVAFHAPAALSINSGGAKRLEQNATVTDSYRTGINLTGTFHVTQLAIPHLRTNRSSTLLLLRISLTLQFFLRRQQGIQSLGKYCLSMEIPKVLLKDAPNKSRSLGEFHE